ncbi:hypothetical protein [Pedobacter sp. SYSU D00535]|uniref:hypothetical protein n=1 Tax=Pedobacter sp. SYSU D00535 TaxID=2810308 RepID=UPI001A968A72|nr:hypothetical protein [Pedobacter sp. SYSU D00535]
MKKEAASHILSIVFLSVFFVKMVISVAPIVIAHFDRESANAVIMQLEIEHSPKASDSKEVSVKEYFTNAAHVLFSPSLTFILKAEDISSDHKKHIQSFYPSVPTPPPNV